MPRIKSDQERGYIAAWMRRERTARMALGGDLTVWIYIYRAPVGGLSLIADGRWTSRRA